MNTKTEAGSQTVAGQVERRVRPDVAEALKREQAALRRLTYKTDAITARLEAIYRTLERAPTGQEMSCC